MTIMTPTTISAVISVLSMRVPFSQMLVPPLAVMVTPDGTGTT